MKILQLIQAKQYRGAEIFCCQLSNHLLNHCHEIVIVSIGVLLDENDDQDFAEAIRRCVKKPNWEQLEKAYEMVTTNFNNETIASAFLKEYEEVIQNASNL